MIFLFLALWYPSCAFYCRKICKNPNWCLLELPSSKLNDMAISCHETWYTHPILPAVKLHALGCIQVGPLRLTRLHLKKKALKSRQGLPGYWMPKARIRQNWTIVKFKRKCHQASEERWLECHTKVGERKGTRRGKLSLRIPTIFVKVNLNLVLPYKGQGMCLWVQILRGDRILNMVPSCTIWPNFLLCRVLHMKGYKYLQAYTSRSQRGSRTHTLACQRVYTVFF